MNNTKNVLLILLFMASLVFSQAVTFNIDVTDGSGSLALTMGFDPSGTDGNDAGLDVLAPPPPPTGNFDARYSINGVDYFTDTRDDASTEKTFTMSYAAATGFGPNVLTWDQADANAKFSSLTLIDDVTGSLFSLDMLSNNSFDVSSSGGFTNNGLRILATPLAPPSLDADFTADVTTGPAPLTVNFSDASTSGTGGAIVGHSWNFGDGTGSSDQNPVKTYNSPGIHTVTLTVTDASSATDTETKVQYINVTGDPQVQFTGSPLTGNAPLAVVFTDQSSAQGGATLTSWSWAFGDGSTSSDQNPSHTYTTPGYYSVTLTVTDNNSNSGSLTKTDYVKVAISTPNTYDISFNVSDGVNGLDLTIGNNPDGTDGFDFGLDQLAPPAPPSGNFDARIVDSVDDFFTDIRDDNFLVEKVWDVEYAAATGNGPIVITWNPADIPTDIRLLIQDPVGAGLFELDMSTTNSLDVSTVSGGALDNGLRIVQQPGVNVFAAVVGPANPEVEIQDGCNFTVKVQIDMTISPAPNDLLGSFTGTLDYAQARLNIVQVSEVLNGYTGNVVVDYANGLITFNGAKTAGQGGVVDVLEIEFETLNGNPSTLDLEFSAMAAANTFEGLLPKLDVTDLDVDPNNDDILLGDVNGDGLVNSTDALIILSFDAGLPTPDQQSRIDSGVGDVNQDGNTNSTDALIILSYDVGLTVFAPVGEKFCF